MSSSLISRSTRLPLTRTTPARFLSTTPVARKSTVEDTVEKVNRKVSDVALDAIEKGQQASQTIKSTVGLNANKAEGSAKEMSGEAMGKAQEMTGSAKGKAQELAGEAKGKASEIGGAAKGKAEEVKRKM
ncbi:hypothetical protein N7G274_007734 [Stereocaulon virgatum]|uniref:LEA domain protein n=1 Tax=Stereocaulon virgatum TaxID=373712 RepID=A0ABR4A0J9_9LECA